MNIEHPPPPNTSLARIRPSPNPPGLATAVISRIQLLLACCTALTTLHRFADRVSENADLKGPFAVNWGDRSTIIGVGRGGATRGPPALSTYK